MTTGKICEFSERKKNQFSFWKPFMENRSWYSNIVIDDNFLEMNYFM